MDQKNYITEAISKAGLQGVSDAVGKSYQAVRKWEKQGHLPRTEWTGETNYAELISEATDFHVTKDQLLSMKPQKNVA